MNYVLEACVDSVESAIAAEKGGANRLELCSDIIVGGTTPDINLYKLVRKNVDIDINILIRPRFGDFLYSNYEIDIIKNNIRDFKQMGANGVVIGVLNENGNLNLEIMKELVMLADGMDITLHRAFDLCEDPFKTLSEAKMLGLNTILTSGQQNDCYKGKELIKRLIEEANGDIDILVGSGVNSSNIKELIEFTNSTSFHLTGKKIINSKMIYRKKEVSMGLPSISEYEIFRTDENEISKVKESIIKYIKER